MIHIGMPEIYEQDGKAYLKAPVTISEDTSAAYMALSKRLRKVHWRVNENYPPVEWQQPNGGLWFSVPLDYKQYLAADRGDAFVAALLWYAMQTGSDIVSDAPVSEKMLMGVNRFVVPGLCKEKDGYRRIKVSAPSTAQIYADASGVGTGMSCGVDSLYTTKQYMKDVPDAFRLTHLAYFNMGAIFHPDTSDRKKKYTVREFYETTDRMSLEKLQNASDVAALTGLPILYICSNMDSDYYRGAYGYTAVYRNCACVLALEGLFRKYYCSSAGWPDYYDPSLSEGSEHYEALLCAGLSTESCEFILSDYASRIEKTREIADWDVAWKYLDVCFNFHNCGHCSKCYRTLLTLDLLGKADRFAPCFDVAKYKAHINQAWGWLLYTKNGNEKDDNAVFARDIYALAKQQKRRIPPAARITQVKLQFRGMLVKLYRLLKGYR